MKKTLKGGKKKGTNQHNKLTRTKGNTGPKYTREGGLTRAKCNP